MPASQRQRTSNIGAAHSACTSTWRTEFEFKYRAASASSKLCA